ncbi:flagellar hook assembly protein FlgD [Lutispora sp.]|uniref:flagellar hook assembly protein FlgD n=1 Tax=Lutispora sp. TaxID=2828727 RepID=UPI003567C985
MGVNGVTGNTNTVYSNNKAKEYTDSLNKDAFLNLLVTQLRYQNPLEPMDDKEFISQMAQFTSLEQAQNTNKIARLNSAYGMVGKLISATISSETGELQDVTGIVDSVRIVGDEAYLVVDSKEIPYESVNEVADLINAVEQNSIMLQNIRFNMAYSMLGKEVKAKRDGVEITGTVESIKSVEGNIKLVVGEYELSLDEIYEVR